jgi:hypothetical protein
MMSQSSLLARIISRLRGEAGAPEGAAHGAEPHLDDHPAASDIPVAPLDPLTIRQWLWGPGFHIPGNAEYVLRLVKPFAANPAMSMLDVAAGLGGPARAISDEFKTYITGLERDPELARRGMEMSIAAGMHKHAPISPIDPETFELRTGAFDCILGRGATYMVQDKERFMRVLILGLKQRGQLLLTEYVLEPSLASRPELALWSGLQPYPASLWTLQQYTDCFKSLGFDIRITEDITHDLKLQIVLGWDHLVQTVDIKALPRAHKLAVVNEAERWVKTIIALDSGAVKAYRFYALAGSTRPPLSSIKKGLK